MMQCSQQNWLKITPVFGREYSHAVEGYES
jgi:hypothetical protein